jgi:hypothetical protein
MVLGLRRMVLNVDPAELGLAPEPARPDVWGGLLDMGMPDDGWATLVVVGDGTVSLYLSTGGGTIGAGEHAAVRAAGQRWLSTLQEGLALLPVAGPPTDQPEQPALPGPGRVVIRALTYAGPRAVEAAEDDLGSGRHPAAPLFHGAHEVLTELRLVDEARNRR